MTSDDDNIVFLRARRGLDRKRLSAFREQLQANVARGTSFTCLLTDDRELQRLNREFLAKDYPTDVLSFPDESGGDLAISTQRAAAQAAEFGHSVESEVEILMLHGVLHLLGMDHETDGGKMRRAETRWRKQFDLPNGLIERTRS
jgi:probable rRNA maturation factor